MLLRKGVQKFDEATIPPKEVFYSKLNLETITDKDYAHVQKVWDAFETKNCGKYHDLYVLCDTLLLADVFENFRNKCIEKDLSKIKINNRLWYAYDGWKWDLGWNL